MNFFMTESLSVSMRYLIGVSIFLSSQALASLGVQMQALALQQEREFNELAEVTLQHWLEESDDEDDEIPEIRSRQVSTNNTRLVDVSLRHSSSIEEIAALSAKSEPLVTFLLNTPTEADSGPLSIDTVSPRISTLQAWWILFLIMIGVRKHSRITPKEARRRVFTKTQWYLGFILYLLDQACGSTTALAFIPPVILAPLGGASLIFNLWFAHLFFGAKITWKDAAGTLLIIAGCSIVSVFGASLPEPNYSMDELMRMFSRAGFIAYTTVQVTSIIGLFAICQYLKMSLDRLKEQVKRRLSVHGSLTSLSPRRSSTRLSASSTPHSSPGRSTDMEDAPTENTPLVIHSPVLVGIPRTRTESLLHLSQQHKHANISQLLGILYAVVGGITAAGSLFLTKSGVTNLLSNQHSFNGLVWVLTGLLILTVIMQLYALNQALHYHLPLIVIPIFYTFYSCFSLVSSLIFWDPLETPMSPVALSLICVGVALIISGVWMLAAHH